MKKLSTIALFAALLLAMPAMAKSSLNPDMTPFKKWSRVVQAEGEVEVSPSLEITPALLKSVMNDYSGFKYATDTKLYGVADYWATRAEFQKNRAGDCEDFVISWYFDLLELGVPDKDMLIAVVVKKSTQELHAVLQVRFDSEVIVLDSEQAEPKMGNYMERFITAYEINRLGWKR